MQVPGRKYTAGNGYRYGFNGKENDNDVKGEGNQQDYGMRIYDPRVGRFLSLDPLTKEYPFYTPYQFAGNKPIKYVDLDGMEEGDAWSDFVNGRGDQVQNILGIVRDTWNGTGRAGRGLDNFNKQVNPAGIVVHDTYSLITGKDLTYGTSRSRIEAGSHLVVNGIMYASGEKFFGQFNATPALEADLNFSSRALQASAKPKSQQASVGLTSDQQAEITAWVRQQASSGVSLKLPQGMTEETFKVMSQRIANRVGDISTNIVVQGSRASGTAAASSDLDIGIKVGADQFNELIKTAFGNPNVGSAKWKTMQYSIENGIIQTGEAKLRDLRSNLETLTGMKVQVSIIKQGGKFDNGAQIPIQATVPGGVH